QVAAEAPEKIVKVAVDPLLGLADYQARALAFALGLSGDTHKKGVALLKAVARAAEQLDTDLLEVNPLVVTGQGDVVALDAKMSFDSNALYRHPDVAGLRDLSEEDPAEVEASKHGLSFIKLDGNIGCLVNGAGLAMA